MYLGTKTKTGNYFPPISILMDTGCKYNLLSRTAYCNFDPKRPSLSPVVINENLFSASGYLIFPLGQVTPSTMNGNKNYEVNFFVTGQLITVAIIDREELQRLSAIIDCSNKRTTTAGQCQELTLEKIIVVSPI